MKLSMWMLADRLTQWSPTCDISGGGVVLTGARLGHCPRSDVVSVTAEGTGVLCAAGADWIRLAQVTAAEVLNVLLDVFEQMTRWSFALEEAAASGAPLQRILDMSAEVVPYPMFFQDNQGQPVAVSGGFGKGVVDVFWDAVVEGKMHHQIFSGPSLDADMRPVRDWSAVPSIYYSPQHRVMGAYVVVDGEIVGAVTVIEFGRAFSQGDCQLVEEMCLAATAALRENSQNAELRTVSSLVGDLMDGRGDSVAVEELLRRLTAGDGPWALVAARSSQRADFNYKSASAFRVSQGAVPCLAVVYGAYILSVTAVERLEDFLGGLEALLFENTYLIGVSLPFVAAEGLPGALGQAELALGYGAGTHGVYRCVDFAYQWLLLRLTQRTEEELLHPALDVLARYDARHRTALYETLRVYLTMERNVVAAARALHIHRNSMLYRLQRIEKLTEVYLDEPEHRMYLMLSYQLRETKHRGK